MELWTRQPGEPAAAYKRFLVYLYLGPGRSLDAAYRAYNPNRKSRQKTATDGDRPRRASGTWFTDFHTYDWKRRADAYDVDTMRRHGRDVVVDFIATLRTMAESLRDAATTLKPGDWSELVDGVAALGAFISPDAVEAIARGGDADAEPAAPDDPAGGVGGP